MVLQANEGPSAFWKMTDKIKTNRFRRSRKQVEAAGVAVLTLTAVCIAGTGVYRIVAGVVNRISAPATAPIIAVPMTVAPGDSLWSLAQRYGDPNAYILNRVDTIAKTNGLPSNVALVPGQRILVPVSNPVELDRLRDLSTVATVTPMKKHTTH